jgi:hypothetical protein
MVVDLERRLALLHSVRSDKIDAALCNFERHVLRRGVAGGSVAVSAAEVAGGGEE